MVTGPFLQMGLLKVAFINKQWTAARVCKDENRDLIDLLSLFDEHFQVAYINLSVNTNVFKTPTGTWYKSILTNKLVQNL